MTTEQAAKKIGISKQQVRWLIRNGKLKARKRLTRENQYGYEYEISPEEATRHRRRKPGRGRPRGAKK